MSYDRIYHYRFYCDAPDCRVTNSIVAANVQDAAKLCERQYGWHSVAEIGKQLFTYCPEHYGQWED